MNDADTLVREFVIGLDELRRRHGELRSLVAQVASSESATRLAVVVDRHEPTAIQRIGGRSTAAPTPYDPPATLAAAPGARVSLRVDPAAAPYDYFSELDERLRALRRK